MVDTLLTYLFHFAFVFGSMIVFFAPFVAIFYWQQRVPIREKKPHFNQFMELFFQSRTSNWLVFLWAVGEATFWFIIPEFLLFLLIFMRISRKRQLLLYDVAGTAVGTVIGLLLNTPEHALLAVPYIFPGMVTAVQEWYHTMGIWGLINQPFSGVPYKVFISEAASYNLQPVFFVILATALRLLRYGLIYCLCLIFYPYLTKYVRKNYAWLFVIGIGIFTLMLMRVSEIYR